MLLEDIQSVNSEYSTATTNNWAKIINIFTFNETVNLLNLHIVYTFIFTSN